MSESSLSSFSSGDSSFKANCSHMCMETALSFLIPDNESTIDESTPICHVCNESESEVEFVSQHAALASNVPENENQETVAGVSCCWITFRVGSAGDASQLASFCKNELTATSCRKHDGNDDNKNNISTNFKSMSKRRRHDCKRVLSADSNNNASFDEKNDDSSKHPAKSDGYVEQIDEELVSKFQSCDKNNPDSEIEKETDADLELRLTSGFGNEQIPPAFYAIIIDIYNSKCFGQGQPNDGPVARNENAEPERLPKSTFEKCDSDEKKTSQSYCKPCCKVEKSLGAAAFVTLGWDDLHAARILQTEFFHVDERKCKEYTEIVTRRLLLRLSALGLATGCSMLYLPDTQNNIELTSKNEYKVV